MPSLQESVTPDAADYVNTDIISQMIKQEITDADEEIIQTPINSVANNAR